MTALDVDRLKHALPKGFTVFMPLTRPLGLDDLRAIGRVFEQNGAAALSQSDVEQQWLSLTKRASEPWEAIEAPFTDRPGTVADWGLRHRRSAHSLENVALRRNYRVYRCGDVEWLVDLFNPDNELGMSYAGAGEPVVLLWFTILGPVNTPFPQSFYEVLAGVDAVLSPRAVIGTRSIFGVMWAHHEKRLPGEHAPWDLLHPLNVVHRSDCQSSDADLAAAFAVVKPWPGNRLLLQLDTTFRPEFRVGQTRSAARLVGRVAADEVLEGRYPAHAAKHPHACQRLWPTPVRDDDTARPSVELVGAADPELVRQALYQVQAGHALQARGHDVRAFQVPFVTNETRITIPVVINREPQIDACGYTQSEPWTAARIADLRQWIADLRTASDSPVIVVSREHSAEVAALPDVEALLVQP